MSDEGEAALVEGVFSKHMSQKKFYHMCITRNFNSQGAIMEVMSMRKMSIIALSHKKEPYARHACNILKGYFLIYMPSTIN